MGNTQSTLDDSPEKEARRAAQARSSPRAPTRRMSSPLAWDSPPRSSNDAVVTVHRPGHLYSHSINLPSLPSRAEGIEGDLPSKHAHHNTWASHISPRAVLAGTSYGRMGGSDTSLVASRTSLAEHSDESTHRSVASDTESESFHDDRSVSSPPRIPSPIATPAFQFPRIKTDLAQDAALSPAARRTEPETPDTPRFAMDRDADTQTTPLARNDRFEPPTRISIPHRASLIITDDLLLPTAGQGAAESGGQPYAPSDSADELETRPRMSKIPSYLKIPTALPRSFASPQSALSDEGANNANSLAIMRMPMYAGSTTEPSEVHAASPATSPGIVSEVNATIPAALSLDTPQSSDEPVPPPAAGEELPLTTAAPVQTPSDALPLTAVNVMWRGKGRKVYVTGTFADEWRSKIPLRQLRPNTPFLCTLHLPPGTHRLKFVVDDRWRVSNDLNTATDGDGTLVNYVEIPWPHSWQANDYGFAPQPTRGDLKPVEDPRFTDPAWASAMNELRNSSKNPADLRGEWDVLGDDMPGGDINQWTSEVPASVEIAQETEEALSEHDMDSDAPALLPLPPKLPRQLEKVILNSSPASVDGSITTAGVLVDDNSVLPAPNHAVLHHLAASAIKNGILAIGTVTRYKRKVRRITDPVRDHVVVPPCLIGATIEMDVWLVAARTCLVGVHPYACVLVHPFAAQVTVGTLEKRFDLVDQRRLLLLGEHRNVGLGQHTLNHPVQCCGQRSADRRSRQLGKVFRITGRIVHLTPCHVPDCVSGRTYTAGRRLRTARTDRAALRPMAHPRGLPSSTQAQAHRRDAVSRQCAQSPSRSRGTNATPAQ